MVHTPKVTEGGTIARFDRTPTLRTLRTLMSILLQTRTNVHPPANQINPSANANLNASQSEAALHQHQPPRSANRKQKNKEASIINNYYYSCSHDSVSVNPHPKHPVSNPTLAPSTTASTSSGGPTKKILALMSLQLTKPIEYFFAVELCSGMNCQGKCSQGSIG